MSFINLTAQEKNALSAIDGRELDKLIDNAVNEEQASSLYGLPLSSCGPYVAQQYSNFQRDLTAYRAAKSGRKREETCDRVRRSGYRLSAAVAQMKRRMETEAEEGQFFYVDDDVMQPLSFSDRLCIVVHYRWRKAVTDNWTHGSIEFNHNIKPRPVYGIPSNRKPSAREQRDQQQNERYDTWESLTNGALQHVQQYLRSGKDAVTIPARFDVKSDAQGLLNNYSTKFWTDKI